MWRDEGEGEKVVCSYETFMCFLTNTMNSRVAFFN
jgi:hypothetical protein